MPKTHELKTWPEYFQAIKDGNKPFEVRENDRAFEVGDLLHLREWKTPPSGRSDEGYTGREQTKAITYIMKDTRFVKPGYVIMGIK